jgi:hypothetical protein
MNFNEIIDLENLIELVIHKISTYVLDYANYKNVYQN